MAVPSILTDAGGAPPDQGPARSGAAPGTRRSAARILVVGADPDLREGIVSLLRPHFHVESAGDGLSALEVVRQRKITLVLSEVERLDGLSLLRALRAEPSTRGIPVILLSARDDQASRINGLEAGADEYLAKPITERELLARVTRCVDLVHQRDVDVTEAKRVQASLTRAEEAAETARRELESFSYSVAHDLRAPLRRLDGFSQALIEDYGDKLEGNGQRYLSFVREAAQQMAQLIDDLLSLSRVTRSQLSRENVDMSALAWAALMRLQRGEPKRSIELTVQEGLTDEGDPHLLAVVFDNLFSNAWKFASKSAEPAIAFGSSMGGGRPLYFVRDNGAGFDMKFSYKLFGVFQRLHSAAEFEGTGIGLATVQRVVRRHGGRVWAEGEPNRGATFYFTLNERGTAG